MDFTHVHKCSLLDDKKGKENSKSVIITAINNRIINCNIFFKGMLFLIAGKR